MKWCSCAKPVVSLQNFKDVGVKKLLSSRIGQVAISTVVVLACLAVMTKWASGKILEHPSIKKYIAERKAESMADATRQK